MRGAGRSTRRAAKEFARNLIWLLAVFGSLAAFLVLGAGVPPLGALAFVGLIVPVLAAVVTALALLGGAPDGTLPGGNLGAGGEGGRYPGGSYHPGYLGGGSGGGGHGGGDFGGDFGGGGGDGGGGF